MIAGRKEEIKILQDLAKSKQAEFLALYGRRRIGKTFLIRNVFEKMPGKYFETSGIKDGSMHQQIEIFISSIQRCFQIEFDIKLPKTWKEAFQQLTIAIDKVPKNQRVFLFFDELPWMVTRKSGLIQALDYYWNNHWCKRNNLTLMVCGSAASWMLNTFVYAKGGLHNRITCQMLLQPFSLLETQEFLRLNNIKYNNRQILEIYLALGGVPYYLKYIKKGLSPSQNINNSCFNENGPLYKEFDYLFSSLFDETGEHKKLIEFIAQSRQGKSRKEIVSKFKKASAGGRLTKKLYELEQAGFIKTYVPYGHTNRGKFYRLIDEYCLFYLFWIKDFKNKVAITYKKTKYWENQTKTQKYKAWSGYSFEAVCYKHVTQILDSLNIREKVEAIGTWRLVSKGQEGGAQIDLVIDRDDSYTNVFEIKNTVDPFVITKEYSKNLKMKLLLFEKNFNLKKHTSLVLISVSGVKENIYFDELVDHVVSLEELFK